MDMAAMDVDRARDEASDQEGRLVTPGSSPSPTAGCDARRASEYAPDKKKDDPECG